ncbi:hypothetical protein [Dechloromonas hortensis]|uniref:hypothetical protein n=1 Tax=Dechloromonas hortensis TaxID=337779 RepID=UPI0012927A98|nr:hypothetical protein [Dechloromonas hortensis]
MNFEFRVDAVEEATEGDEDRVLVKFTMLRGFETPPIFSHQIGTGISDIEGRRVWPGYCAHSRTGWYYITGNSKFAPGQVVVGTIRTQLRPAMTKDEIITQLSEDPRGRMVVYQYGSTGWIVPDPRATGGKVAEDGSGGNSEEAEFIPSLCMVAELLREGLLELDGEGYAKLAGYTFTPAIGSDFCYGTIGEDFSLNDCFDLIDRWGGAKIASEFWDHWL